MTRHASHQRLAFATGGFAAPTQVNRADVLKCLDARIPAAVAAALCGFAHAEEQPAVRAAARPLPMPALTPAPPPPPPAPAAEFCLPMATTATTDLRGFADQQPDAPRQHFYTEDELRAQHGPPPLDPLMPLPRLWPYLHRVLGHRRPGHRLDAQHAARLVARGRPLGALPRLPVQRWSPQARLVLDRTLPPGFLSGDLELLCQTLKALRGETGMFSPDPAHGHGDRGPAALRSLPVQVVDELEDIAALQPHPLPTLVVSDLGQLRQDPALMAAWLACGRRLAAAGVTPVALVPCPRDRWNPALAAVWRCACWDRHATLPPPGQGLEAVADPAVAAQAARRTERLLSRLAPAALIEPALLRAIRGSLPEDAADIGTEFDVRVGGALAVAGYDLALRPAVQRSYAARFQAEPPVVQEQVRDLILRHHQGYGPQLRAGEILALADLGVLVARALQDEALVIQDRTNDTMLRDLDAPEQAARLGLFAHTRWAHPRWSKSFLATPQAATAWAFLCRYEQRVNPAIPDGMNPAHVQAAMTRVVPDPGYVTTWAVRLDPSAGPATTLELRPWTAPVQSAGGDCTPACKSGAPLALFHVRRLQVQMTVQCAGREQHTSLMLQEGQPCRFPAGACERVALLSDCGTLDLAPAPPPPWATAFGWDQFGQYAECRVHEVACRLRWIPPGKFLMGSPDDEEGRYEDEGPQRRVTIAAGFWLGETPVTQAFYQAVLGHNPSEFMHGRDAARRPAEQVSWADCQAMLAELNDRVHPLAAGHPVPASDHFRLPSEAEWEYACRAGTATAYYDGSACTVPHGQDPALDRLGWYGNPRGGETHPVTGATHPVKEKAPNAWGLYDMLGNVSEWCADYWHRTYEGAPTDGSVWVEEGVAENDVHRVTRGGSWYHSANRCRSASRGSFWQGVHAGSQGFRLCCAPRSTASPAAPPAPARGWLDRLFRKWK